MTHSNYISHQPHIHHLERKNILACDCQMSETLARTGLEIHHAVRAGQSKQYLLAHC